MIPIGFRSVLCCVGVGLIAFFPASAVVSANTADGRAGEGAKVFYIGHSLMSDIPDMVQALAKSAGIRFDFKEQFIPGAPLRWQWKEGRSHRGEPQFQDNYDKALPDGNYDALVVTDGVPRGGAELEAETVDYLARFQAYATTQNPRCQVYYYETWHHITSGTPQNSEYDTASPRRTLRWRERLSADRAMWDGIVSEANKRNAGKGRPILMIPAGRALAMLDDAVKRGEVPGIVKTRDYFDDEIHLNPYGKYFVACVHFAVLFNRSPVGLTGDAKGRWGESYWDTRNWQGKSWARPDPAAITAMQRIAWEAVRAQLK